MMIIAIVVIGTLFMIPFVAQAPIAPVATAIQRCPQLGEFESVAVTGKVVYLYAPRVVSADMMELRFDVSGSHPPACNCSGFLYQSKIEEVRAMYAALLTAVNNSKLVVTFCCPSGSQGVACAIGNPSIKPAE